MDKLDGSPDQPRDENGRWVGSSSAPGTHYEVHAGGSGRGGRVEKGSSTGYVLHVRAKSPEHAKERVSKHLGPEGGAMSMHVIKHNDAAGVQRFDSGLALQKPQRLDNGFLRVDGYIARTGVQVYMNADGSARREYRPPEEVFKQDTMASFELSPVTNDHPREGFVSAKNRRALSVGTTSNVRKADKFVAASLQIEDADAIGAVESGKQELSCGYYCDLDPTPGVSPDGEKYDCIQRNIRGNHVALVAVGRAGPLVRVRMDNLDAELLPSNSTGPSPDQEKHVKLSIDGIEVEVPETAGAVVQKALKDREAKSDAAEKNAVALQAKLDAAQDALKKAEQARADAADPKRLDAAVRARVELIQKATEILGEAPKAELSDRDVKVAVIQKLSPSFKADGKDDAYVTARYDAALEYAVSEAGARYRAATGPIPAPQVHGDAGSSVDVEKARREFEQKNQNAWKAQK